LIKQEIDNIFYGQLEQDKFIVSVLAKKHNGYFLELGSNHPKKRSNTFLLEKKYGWKGIMIDSNINFLPLYKKDRQESVHIIHDASTIDYSTLLSNSKAPPIIDYLQIDLEVSDNSTINTLLSLKTHVMSTYKFTTITFEHDIYRQDWQYVITRARSRKIFADAGYLRVFSDVGNLKSGPFEDWYVYPDLVDMSYIKKLQDINIKNYTRVKDSVPVLYYQNILY
jgi:hypothetical protein